MVPFAGWEMPIQYSTGVIAEHRAVRESAGIFDVSHMGVAFVRGAGAEASLQGMLSNDVTKLHDGGAQYTLLTNAEGGIEDDLILYRLAPHEYMLVLNASNAAHDLDLLVAGAGANTSVGDDGPHAIIALQGPLALEVLVDRLQVDLVDTPSFRVLQIAMPDDPGATFLAATTGYTGERGCELVLPEALAIDVWRLLAADPRVTPCGLGARDTLRLEMGYPLHGNDISPQVDAVSSGLSWAIGWDTGFTGEDALRLVRQHGASRQLVALEATGRGIPRAGCDVLDATGAIVGSVTSGTMSPMLGVGIALARVDAVHAGIGTSLAVDVRGRSLPVIVRKRPFYRHA